MTGIDIFQELLKRYFHSDVEYEAAEIKVLEVRHQGIGTKTMLIYSIQLGEFNDWLTKVPSEEQGATLRVV